ncbi:hypothetical protein A9Q99_25685 [Gammaproteobacteria bacterium 45_16_T64]|nr:hypothetical protein A9Q99_25685 [Gammaproteobacteria bacterium 45_16_T64]
MKTAFITGSATGIGHATCNRLLKEGWRVFAGHLDGETLDPAWKNNPNITTISCDVTNPTQIADAAALVSDMTHCSIDLLFNNAGYADTCGVLEAVNMADYRRHFDINFFGPLNVIQSFAPLVKQAKGRVINTTSASVYMTIPLSSAYPVSKIALKALTYHFRMEMKPFGVEVTSLEPGGVKTNMTNLDTNRIDTAWKSIPERLRAEYQKHFLDGVTAIGDNFAMCHPDEFADEIYTKVICAKKLKAYYLLGPGVSIMPWLHRLLPAQTVLNIWTKMFTPKKVKAKNARDSITA